MSNYTLETLLEKFSNDVGDRWHEERRTGNDGSAGNTLEDLLEIPENNLTLPDWGEIEIKTKRKESQALLTLLHREPLPPASLPKLLLSLGWRHKEAGGRYPDNELSFRSTTRANDFSDRGFAVKLSQDKISFIFDPAKIAHNKTDKTGVYSTYGDWLADVQGRTPHFSTILPVYWEKDFILGEIKNKLDRTLIVLAKTKTENGARFFQYESAYLFAGFKPDNVDHLFNEKALYVDFDARTRHNHGTKFRIDLRSMGRLFSKSVQVT